MQYDEICECGHNKKAHLDDVKDANTATDCQFRYNCDCEKYRPRIIFKAAYVDDQKYLHSARSLCCDHWMVAYNEIIDAKVHWVGIGEPPRDLECRRCAKKVFE